MTPITEYRSHLCLGGPRDGQRYDAGEVSSVLTTPLEAIQLLLAGYRPNAGGNRTP